MKKSYYFASANTGTGFVNFLDQINEKNQPSFQYIIKGGSGTGKSTMLKKIAKYFEAKNFSIEYFYCSTDTSSLDGIRIVEKNISIVDGTAPHTIDANLPSVENKIVNVGEFISLKTKDNIKEIKKLAKQKESLFSEIYLLLKSAKSIQDIELSNTKVNYKKYKQECKKIIKNFNLKKGKSYERKLFLESYNLSNNNLIKLNNFKKIIKINKNKLKNNIFLNIFNKLLKKYKTNYITIRNNLDSSLIDGIIIKDILICFSSYNLNILISNIQKLVVEKIEIAKSVHKEIEKLYVKNVDFKGVDLLTEKLISEIENFK